MPSLLVLKGSGGVNIAIVIGVHRDYYKDPLPHSPLITNTVLEGWGSIDKAFGYRAASETTPKGPST